MLGALLRVGEQALGQPHVLLLGRAPRPGAGRRVDDGGGPGDRDQRLRRGADDVERRLAAGEPEQVHVRRGVGRPEHPVDVEGVDGRLELEALRQHHLEGVAGADVLADPLDAVLVHPGRHVAAHRRHLGRLQHGHAGRHGLGEVGGHRVQPGDGVVVPAAPAQGVGDEQDAAVGVVEDGQVGDQRHRQLGHAEVVGARLGQPLQPADDVVAQVADQPAGERGQAGHPGRPEPAGQRPDGGQRVARAGRR